MSLIAWETDDGDIVVWGTHDKDLAKIVIKAAIHDDMITMDPHMDSDENDLYKMEFWEQYKETDPVRRWAHESLLHEEVWPSWLVISEEQPFTVPVMRFYR